MFSQTSPDYPPALAEMQPQCHWEMNAKCIHFDDFLGAISQPEPVACCETDWPGVTVNIIIYPDLQSTKYLVALVSLERERERQTERGRELSPLFVLVSPSPSPSIRTNNQRLQSSSGVVMVMVVGLFSIFGNL